jgi:hypothetical protein
MIENEHRDKWDRRYEQAESLPLALEVLVENSHLLPSRGTALDLAFR